RVFTRHVLQQYADVFELVAEADTGKTAIEQINRLQPELIFLDIQMPDMDGFGVLEQLQHKPMVIFLTAYHHYAIKAFEANGVDYLLKPLLGERLEHSIRKLELQYPMWLAGKEGIDHERLRHWVSEAAAPDRLNRSMTVKQGNKMILLALDEIVAFQSKEKYTAIKTKDGREFLDNKSLAELAGLLPDHFLRIQKSVIVNTHHILQTRKHFNRRFYFYLDDKANTVVLSGHTYAGVIHDTLLAGKL
ncbi:MAG TPA: LytTR family DNA-binding domain-containing protein, partial [Chitinophagaceae bacterium]|nr:LytTR family DNA-binding domain-containing protein [Chitinophagaceae bacterium]